MPVTGTNGSDLITFQGTLQQFTATLVNPYSGNSIFVDAVKRVNGNTYDGLGGTDALFMSAAGDVIFLNDGNGNATLKNIEQIVAGDGADVVFLADSILTMGNVVVAGGTADDIIWMNAGDDTVNAFDGNDIVEGGPGNDMLNGENGDDSLWGNTGNDILNGGAGNDTLFGGQNNDALFGGDGDDTLYGGDGPNEDGSIYQHAVTLIHTFLGAAFPMPLEKPTNAVIPVANQGIQPDNLQVSFSTTIHAEYIWSEAGYRNSLGFYKVGADGTISDVQIVFKNQHNISYGDTFTYDYNGVTGESLGIFILANGYGEDAFYRTLDLSAGALNYIYDFGGANQRAATINDMAANVRLVFDDGTTQTALNVTSYHSALSGGVSTLNHDGIVHTISGLANANDPTVFRVGFEDLSYLGDADFDDIVFNMTVENRTILTPGVDDNDILNGGAGNDTLYGGFGNDLLIFGQGADNLYGGDGSDTFLMNYMDTAVDQIFDFDTGAGKDVLDISNILEGYNSLTSAFNDFVRLVHNGGNDDLYVNADGDPGGVFQRIVTFDGGLGGVDLSTLIADGNLALVI